LKRTVAISLLLSLLVPYAFLYFWIRYEKEQIREEVKHGLLEALEKDQLTFFDFSVEEVETLLDWEHEGEFELNGQMYDVVERITQDGHVHLWCWPDQKETELNKQLDSLLAGTGKQDQTSRDRQQRIIQVLKHVYLTETMSMEPGFLWLTSSPKPPVTDHWMSFEIVPPTPPPKIV
jgi:hypothetical protein